MIDESGEHSRSHRLTTSALELQAEALNLPLYTKSAKWGEYEGQFKIQLKEFKKLDIEHGVFGDIDLEAHREWVTRVCNESNLTAHLPLWGGKRSDLVKEFVTTGFKAVIIVVNRDMMPKKFLGRTIVLL